MGVLIPGNDMTAVRRTAAFFLQNLQERLDVQRAEAAANADYNKTFKGQATKEEKQEKRKQILSNIGEDLLLASADKVRPAAPCRRGLCSCGSEGVRPADALRRATVRVLQPCRRARLG